MADTMTQTAKLIIDGKEYEFPVIEGTEGERAIDISKLRAQTGYITMDPGYANTGSCKSSITFINGEEGILRYRGYPIDQLASQSSFLETSYLVLYGELPSKAELDKFENEITYHTLLHEDMRHMYQAFPLRAHPMAVTSALVGSLSTFYQQEIDPLNDEHRQIQLRRLIAKLPTICAWAYKYSAGHPFVYPRNDLSYAGNLLHMMFATPAEPYEVKPALERAIDTLLILHADHEQNCSTTAMRTVGSAHADPYISTAAAASALYGPRHGGANEAVIKMLNEIGSPAAVPAYVEEVKAGSKRLQGFGHRVYKNYDPRAKIMKKMCDKLLGKLKIKDPLLDLAKELEEIALKDDYFVEHNLYPNVDFYSGIILRAIGIPTNMFTVLFAIGRLPGWIAHWREQNESPDAKIARPRQIYTGNRETAFTPTDQRD